MTNYMYMMAKTSKVSDGNKQDDLQTVDSILKKERLTWFWFYSLNLVFSIYT